jgi:hypothetical protein
LELGVLQGIDADDSGRTKSYKRTLA